MSQWINLRAEDGHELEAYLSEPDGTCQGAIVLVQEIFGVNDHIRRVADGFAREGFLVVVPALFDRVRKGVQLEYEGEDMKTAVELMHQLSPETALLDIKAAFERAKASDRGVAVIGYCYGGLMSWLSATRGEDLKMRPDCCVAYYPGGIGGFAAEEPSCPVMIHIGSSDSHIGEDQISAVRSAHPEVEVFIYEGAEHGFNCDARSAYQPASAALAGERTLKFLQTHIA